MWHVTRFTCPGHQPGKPRAQRLSEAGVQDAAQRRPTTPSPSTRRNIGSASTEPQRLIEAGTRTDVHATQPSSDGGTLDVPTGCQGHPCSDSRKGPTVGPGRALSACPPAAIRGQFDPKRTLTCGNPISPGKPEPLAAVQCRCTPFGDVQLPVVLEFRSTTFSVRIARRQPKHLQYKGYRASEPTRHSPRKAPPTAVNGLPRRPLPVRPSRLCRSPIYKRDVIALTNHVQRPHKPMSGRRQQSGA